MSIKNKIINKEYISLVFLVISTLIIIYSQFLFPIVISIIITYLINNLINFLSSYKIKKKILFPIIYTTFITAFLIILFILIPMFFKQLIGLFNDLPFMIQKIKLLTSKYMEKYPSMFSTEQTNLLFSNIIAYVQSIGKTLISASILSITIIIKWILYILLIPVFVFFLSKDHEKLLYWIKTLIPNKTKNLNTMWKIINKELSNYIKGKMIEIIIMIITNYILFRYYRLVYSDLLAFGVGLSAIIPYIGSVIISIPIILIAAVQFGMSNELIYLISIYLLIQFIDGNLLVPILFSETLNLHPIAIMISIIIFGSLLGIYGMFFAIPFAICLKTILKLYLDNNNKNLQS